MNRNGTLKGGDEEGGRHVHWRRLIFERNAEGWFVANSHTGLSF